MTRGQMRLESQNHTFLVLRPVDARRAASYGLLHEENMP